MKLITIIRLLLMAGMACASLTGKAALQGDFDPKHLYPSRELATPHVKWLTPSAEAPLKVLFLVSQDRMREIVELAQRMDLDYQVAVVGNFKHPESGAFSLPPLHETDLRRDLQEKLDSAVDLIVVSCPDWQKFSYMQRYQILKKVKDGTPLLTFAAGIDEYFARAAKNKVKEDYPWLVPWKGLPAFSTNYAGTTEFQAGTLEKAVFGRGNIYLLKGYKTVAPQALTPIRGYKRSPRADPYRYETEDATFELNSAEYDYYLGMIIHIMRAAVRKTLPVEIQADDYLKINRDATVPINFTIKSADARQVVLRFAVRTRQGNVLVERQQTMQLKAGENKAAFETGKIPSGDYFADLWVQDNDKILEFASIYIETSGSNTLVGMELTSAIHCNEGASGKALLNIAPAAEGLTLHISQRDTFGRVTARVSLPVTREMIEKKEAAFTLPATTPLTIIQYLDVELCRGKDVLDRESKWFSICDFSPADDVSFVIWATPVHSYLSYYFMKNLHDAGFDTQYANFSEPLFLANMRYIPYATRLVDKTTDKRKEPRKVPHVREPCLTDPEYRKAEGDKLARVAERLRPFSVKDFSLGDENRFLYLYQIMKEELCFSPTCAAAFHEFLKKEYNTIENLNGEYGTHFKSFDEIKPLTLDEVRKDPKLIPLWVDFRRHMESTWAGMLAFCRDAVQKEIPNARIGYEGTDYDYINSLQGFDWQKIMNAIQLNDTYDGVFAPYAVVDLSRPGTMLGTGWYGGYEEYKKYNDWDSRAYNQYISWRHLFRGANSFWVWTAGAFWAGYGHASITAPDFSFLECFTPNIPEMKEIKSGAGKLLMNAKRENDRTAILYSASSVHAATLSDSVETIEGVLHSLIPLMEDTFHQFKIISYQQLADGVLEKDGYAFLILPYAQALSQKEAENIRSFAKNGGTVIADVRPGICNEHGKAYAKGALDDIFGVLHNPCVTQKLDQVTMAFNDPALPTNIITLVDSTLKLHSGQAQARAGEAPALIVNGYGKGKAILMNFTLHRYQKNADDVLAIEVERLSKQAPEMRAVFERVLDLAGINPKIKFAPEISGLRAYRHQAGDLRYIGFLQHPCRARAAQFGEINSYKLTFNRTQIPVPVKTTATLDGKYHVYDIRRGKYLGYTDTIPMEVGPGRAEFYSLLPYEVQGLEIRAPGRVRQGKVLEWSAQLKIKGDKAGLHIFRITLKSPSGKEIGYYADNVKAEQGQASGKIPLALNDEPGAWIFRIKDVASGQTTEAAFNIGPEKITENNLWFKMERIKNIFKKIILREDKQIGKEEKK